MAKKNRTKAVQAYYDKVAELGCVICKRPANIHHMLRVHGIPVRGTGLKAADNHIIPLCHEHHQGGNAGTAIHAGIDSWEKVHGTEQHYLELVWDALGVGHE